MPALKQLKRILTGIPEFDAVLKGGLPEHTVTLLEGEPGTGKTTFALQFLIEGAKQGERCLYVTLSETEADLRRNAASHGWTLDGIDFFELTPSEAEVEQQQSVLNPAEFELSETVGLITRKVEELAPDRLVIDALSELRLLAYDALRYRRQILALKQFLQQQVATVFLLDDLTAGDDKDLHSVVHAVVSLEQRERTYGAARRRLRIVKMRGGDFQSGWHDFAITTGAVLVFPSLIAEEHRREFSPGQASSGLDSLDELLGGGLDRGTGAILVGPSGAGKSSLALQYAMAAVGRDEYAAFFSFDETFETFERRATGLGFDVRKAVDEGKLGWRRSNPSRLTPGEFVWQVRREVEDKNARIIVIDSINSYLATMPEETALMLQLHELLTYLNNMGVVTFLILAQQGVVGDLKNPIDLSFLSDNVILIRFFEAEGEVRKAISVVKKRAGVHELAIREFRLFPDGMRVGPQLLDFHGVLTGNPSYAGPAEPLLSEISPG